MIWAYVPERCLEQQVLTLPVVSACSKYAPNCMKRGFSDDRFGFKLYESVTTEQPRCLGGNPGNIRQKCTVLVLGKLKKD